MLKVLGDNDWDTAMLHRYSGEPIHFRITLLGVPYSTIEAEPIDLKGLPSGEGHGG